MKFNLIIPEKTVALAYRQVLQQAAATTTIKGFRQGKAPLKVVEASLDRSQLYQPVLRQVIPLAYLAYLKKHQLKPVTSPKVTVKTAQAKGDWELEVEIYEKPQVELGAYQSAVKGALAKNKIWTPNQGDPKTKKAPSDSDKLNTIIEVLLSTAQVKIPPPLIDDAVEQRLSNLLYQIDKLGLNFDSYAASLNQTPDSLKAEYAKEAESSLKIEFIFDAIAQAEKLTASPTEVNQFITKIDNPQVKASVQKDTQKQAQIAAAITKRRVTDYLMNLGS